MSCLELLDTYLPRANVYGEYGAGLTTKKATTFSNLTEIHSVESDRQWIQDIKHDLKDATRVTFHYKEMGTTYKSWGHPGPAATADQKRAYSDAIQSNKPIDILLIDGRFRVACALKAHGWLSHSAKIVFDDFWIRPHYHIVLDYFTVLERSGTAALLERKPDISVPEHLIQTYELIVD